MKRLIGIVTILFILLSVGISYAIPPIPPATGVTGSKTSGQSGSFLLFDDYLTEALGGGWLGPHCASSISNSYFLQLPCSQPTLGQELVAGTPASNISRMYWAKGAGNQVYVASPTYPNSGTLFTMQGLAGSITPAKTGNILIIICGSIVSASGTINYGVEYQISYGTGGAPTSNAALTGTQIGSIQVYTNPVAVTAADVHVPFSISSIVTGLTIGTAYWIDLAAFDQLGASSVGFSVVTVTAIEF